MNIDDILDCRALFLTIVVLVGYKYLTKPDDETVVLVPRK